MTKTIFFDMDGTIANLYKVNNWLDKLIAEDATPYAEAEPMMRMASLARVLNTLKNKGYNLGIISWTSKGGSRKYNDEVARVKAEWLYKHLASVEFDEMHIVAYGTKKANFAHTAEDVLFDDEEQNRNAWTGKAFTAENILETLKSL